jgi:hypothetical protein
VDWAQAANIGKSLLLSPIFGFAMAATLFMVLKAVVKNKKLYEAPEGTEPPPFWIRGLLILTCTGVSFFHGSNDGQKGMGLIMLILIGTVPTTYALNHAVTASQSQDFIAVSTQTADTLGKYVQESAAIGDPREDVTDYIRTKEFKPNTMLALRALVNGIGTEMAIFKELKSVPQDRVRNFRNDMYLASEAIRLMQKSGKPVFAAADVAILKNYKSHVDHATLYPGRDGGRTKFGSSFQNDCQKLPCVLDDCVPIAGFQSMRVHQFPADSQRRRTRFQELGCGVQIHATGRHQRYTRQRTLQRLDIFRAANLPARENFHEIRPRFPRGNDFGRSQRAGHDQLPFPHGQRHGFRLKSWAHQKLCAGVKTLLRHIGIEYRPRADQQLRSRVLRQLANHVDGSRHRHGDLHDRNAALANALRRNSRLGRGRGAHHRHDTDLQDAIANRLLFH